MGYILQSKEIGIVFKDIYDPFICCIQETYARFKNTSSWKWRDGMILHANHSKREQKLLLISDKCMLNEKSYKREKKGFILIKNSPGKRNNNFKHLHTNHRC